MSRAFVKDEEEGPDDAELPPDSPNPLPLTPEGLARLRGRLAALQSDPAAAGPVPTDPIAALHRQQLRRDIKLLRRKLARAVVVEQTLHSADQVAFGHWVTVADASGRQSLYRIVGEEEDDPAAGWISWLSPLAAALRGNEVGESVLWRRPAGDRRLTIIAIHAEKPA
jgi:transcription elongation GreA/GreB family factor